MPTKCSLNAFNSLDLAPATPLGLLAVLGDDNNPRNMLKKLPSMLEHAPECVKQLGEEGWPREAPGKIANPKCETDTMGASRGIKEVENALRSLRNVSELERICLE